VRKSLQNRSAKSGNKGGQGLFGKKSPDHLFDDFCTISQCAKAVFHGNATFLRAKVRAKMTKKRSRKAVLTKWGLLGFFGMRRTSTWFAWRNDLGFCGKTLVFKRENSARALISKIRIPRFARLPLCTAKKLIFPI
jgi:hypothetical protein